MPLRNCYQYQVLTPLSCAGSAELEIAVCPNKDLAEYEFEFFPKEGDHWPEASADELEPKY
jgi:hypothetical protein